MFLGEGDVNSACCGFPGSWRLLSHANAVSIADKIRDCCPVNNALNKQVTGMSSLGKVSFD